MANKQFSNVFLPPNRNMRIIFMGHCTRVANVRGANAEHAELTTHNWTSKS